MTIFIVFIFYISVFNWTHLFRINLYLNISNTKKNKPVYCVILSFSSELCTVVGAVYTSVFIQENIILKKKTNKFIESLLFTVPILFKKVVLKIPSTPCNREWYRRSELSFNFIHWFAKYTCQVYNWNGQIWIIQ